MKRVVRGPEDAWSLWECADCHAFPVFPSEGFRRELYDKTYFEPAERPTSPGYSGYLSYDRHRHVSREDIIRLFKPLVSHETRALDIGCATGIALEAFRELGVPEAQLSGIDISAYAPGVARVRLPRATIMNADAMVAELGGPYDLVLLLDVLEHVTDPAALFRRAAGTLSSGGTIVVITPDPDSLTRKMSGRHWSEFRFSEHLCFVGRRWFDGIARQTGLRIVSRSHPGKRVTVEHAASRLRAYLPFFPALRSQRLVRLNARDRQLVILERPRV